MIALTTNRQKERVVTWIACGNLTMEHIEEPAMSLDRHRVVIIGGTSGIGLVRDRANS
jgi:hypothetical protein